MCVSEPEFIQLYYDCQCLSVDFVLWMYFWWILPTPSPPNRMNWMIFGFMNQRIHSVLWIFPTLFSLITYNFCTSNGLLSTQSLYSLYLSFSRLASFIETFAHIQIISFTYCGRVSNTKRIIQGNVERNWYF